MENILDVLEFLDILNDLLEGNFCEINKHIYDKESFTARKKIYENQIENIDKNIKNMVENDIKEEIEETSIIEFNIIFKTKENLRKKYYKELGIEYKTLMEIFPEVDFF